jgi:dihydroorotate dehydrogenase (fumarate)
MANLNTSYLGLNMPGPIVVSSSGLTDSVSKIRKLEEYGAGAVVLKSLFEEQINFEAGRMMEQSQYPEASDYLKVYTRSNSVSEYLKLIEDSKKSVKIPIIASINCVSADEWIDFAKNVEDAGADALEMNLFFLPLDKDFMIRDFEKVYYDLAVGVRSKVKIPISVKLGQNFTNLPKVVENLHNRGVAGVVLFNRFYEPDIDLDHMKFKAAEVFSSPSDFSKTLRWVGIVSDKVKQVEIAASTGIHDGKSAIKAILAGARVAMVCSAIYKNGPEYLKTMIQEMNTWLDRNNHHAVNDIRGLMNYGKIKDPSVYERSQFMKYFSSLQ